MGTGASVARLVSCVPARFSGWRARPAAGAAGRTWHERPGAGSVPRGELRSNRSNNFLQFREPATPGSSLFMTIDRQSLDTAPAGVIDPNTGRDLVASKTIKNVVIDGAKVHVEVVLGYPS